MRRIWITESEQEALDFEKFKASKQPVLWQPDLSAAAPYGFDQIRCDFNGVKLNTPSDEAGANLSVVTLDGGPVIRHFAQVGPGGFRSQAGIWSWKHPEIAAQLSQGVILSYQVKFDQVLRAGDTYSWRNLGDIHSSNKDGTNRAYTGLNLATDGSMRVYLAWLGQYFHVNPASDFSSIPLPVGRWPELKIEFIWSEQPTTIRFWIDEQLAIEQSGVITRLPGHESVEFYPAKLYGASPAGHEPWNQNPMIQHTRNIKLLGRGLQTVS